MAVVSVSPLNEHTTCTLYSTCVPRHSFIKATIVPDLGYTIYGFKIGNSLAYYYKSSEEENTYHILLNESNNILEVLTSDNQEYSISISTEKCSFYSYIYIDDIGYSISYDKFLSGKELILPISPYDGYYVDTSCITIAKQDSSDSQNANIVIIPDSKSNRFKFIMPNYDIQINVVGKLAISSDVDNYSFKIGDLYNISLNNRTPDSSFTVKVSEGYKYYPRTFTIGYYEILSDSYTIPAYYFDDESETGNYILKVYPNHNSEDVIFSVNLNINLINTPEGWSTIGIKNNSSNFLSIIDGSYIYLSKAISDSLKVKYKLTKNNSSDIYEGEQMCNYNDNNQGIYFNCPQLSSLSSSYDKLNIWIEDDDKKLISRKIVVNTH